jgi:hypothetical protein
MLTPAEFAAQYAGQTDVGGGCGGFSNGECTALTCLWAVNLGLSTPCGSCGAPYHCDGVCWQGSGYPGWTWIPNSPTNFPSPGDLVCFKGGCHGIGPDGHVDLCLSASPTTITSLANNWGCYKCCQIVTHNDYNCVVGWQHPNVVAVTPPSPPPSPPPPATCSPPCAVGWTCSDGDCIPTASVRAPGTPVAVKIAGIVAINIAAIIGGVIWRSQRGDLPSFGEPVLGSTQ